MSSPQAKLIFSGQRCPGHSIGIISSRPSESGLSGFPIVSFSADNNNKFSVGAIEFGADLALYPTDPLVCHSEELHFQEAGITFRELVLCHRVAVTARKKCILHTAEVSIEVRKI